MFTLKESISASEFYTLEADPHRNGQRQKPRAVEIPHRERSLNDDVAPPLAGIHVEVTWPAALAC